MSTLTTDRIRDHATRLGLTHLSDTITELVTRAEAAQMGYLDFVEEPEELLRHVTDHQSLPAPNGSYWPATPGTGGSATPE